MGEGEGGERKLTLVFFTHFGLRALAGAGSGSGFFSAGTPSGFFSAAVLLSAAGSSRWSNRVGAAGTGVEFSPGVVCAGGGGTAVWVRPLPSLVVTDCWVTVTTEDKLDWWPVADQTAVGVGTADPGWKESANRVNIRMRSESRKRGNIFCPKEEM